MTPFYYDLHMHSCLSSCADDDMTPQNMVAMAHLKGLSILALTDHNSTANCKTFLSACEAFDICGICGMELTTAEEIHLLCLFSSLDDAESFDRYLDGYRIQVINKPDIFGHQLYVGEDEHQEEYSPYLLSTATMLSVDDALLALRKRGAFVCPAHVDRTSNGMIGILGTVPSDYAFGCIEYREEKYAEEIRLKHALMHTKSLYNSDAHFLWDIAEAEHSLSLPCKTPTAHDVIGYLRS